MESNTSANVDICKFLTPDKVKMTRSEIEYICPDYTLLKILEEGLHADITLTAIGGSIKAHRCVLAGMSPVFRAMFDHDMKEQLSSTVNILDMSIDGLQLFLLLLYSTNEHDKNASGALELLPLVSAAIDKHFNELFEAVLKYQVVYRLRNILWWALLRNLAPDNCWYYYGRSLEIAGLSSALVSTICEVYILGNYNEVITSESIAVEMRCNPERVQRIIISADSSERRRAALETYSKVKELLIQLAKF